MALVARSETGVGLSKEEADAKAWMANKRITMMSIRVMVEIRERERNERCSIHWLYMAKYIPLACKHPLFSFLYLFPLVLLLLQVASFCSGSPMILQLLTAAPVVVIHFPYSSFFPIGKAAASKLLVDTLLLAHSFRM